MFCSPIIDSLIMKILFYLFIVIYFQSTCVVSRTLRIVGSELVNSDTEGEMILTPKSEYTVIWTKSESKALNDWNGNNSGNEETLILQKSFELPKLLEKEGFEGKEAVVEKLENSDLENFTTESMFGGNNGGADSKASHSNRSLVVNDTDFSTVSDDAQAVNTGHISLSVLPELESGNFTDTVVFNFHDSGEDTTVVKEIGNGSVFVESNDTLITDEDENALFQGIPTFGFEFLIDSHVTRNSLLSELLSSQSILPAEDNNDGLLTHFGDEEHSTLEIGNIHIDGTERELNASLLQDDNFLLKNGLDDLVRDNIEPNTGDLNPTETEQNVITERNIPCPNPGWCFFWFLSQDTCAENVHCHGSRICCKLGCSKTCLDV